MLDDYGYSRMNTALEKLFKNERNNMTNEHQYSFAKPYAISTELAPTIQSLGLTSATEQLRDEGYTIVNNAVPVELCKNIREAILELANEDKGSYFDISKGDGFSCFHLLGRNPFFADALLNPQLLALAEFLCGADFQLSQLAGSVRFEGAKAMALHMDAQWIPPTEYNGMFTACLALDDLTEEAGTTKVVPGSHKLMRNPDDLEAAKAEGAIPLEMPVGSLGFWNGFTWHSNYARVLPGERVMLHLTFCRLAYRPVEDYSNLGEEFLKDYPPVMATMLGRHSYFGLANCNGGQVDMVHYPRMWEASRR